MLDALVAQLPGAELNNGQINVEWRVAQGTEVKPLLTKRESFEEMKRENPALA